MSIPCEQLCSSQNTDTRLPYMRLPSYKSLRLQRYQPYTTTHTGLFYSPVDVSEPIEDADILVAQADLSPVSISLPMVLEDDCMDGLRTVVCQMSGRDKMRLGSVHLVIDFAFILRNYRHKRDAADSKEPGM